MDRWSDAHIDGETPIDPSGLKIRGITTRAELSAAEAENIRLALVKYLAAKPSSRLAPFTVEWSQKLHREMFGDVWDWAGMIRNRDLNIGLPLATIRENLAALIDDLHHWSEHQMPFIEQAARLHYRAVYVHPFENGNGRWSRMMANVWLKLNGQPITVWPEHVIGSASVIRSEYLAAIKRANNEGDLSALVELHARYAEDRS